MNPPPLQADHVCRISVLEPERAWSLRGDMLAAAVEGSREWSIPLSSITCIRLVFAPTRVQRNRWRCLLYTTAGKVATIQNEHYKGIMNFEDRSLSYRGLVTALVRRTAAVNPACRFASGNPPAGYWSNVIFLTGMLALLVWLLWIMSGSIGGLVVIKLLILLFYIPTAALWIIRNRPGRFTPDAIPESLLPAVEQP